MTELSAEEKSQLCQLCGNCCKIISLEVRKEAYNPKYNLYLRQWLEARGIKVVAESQSALLVSIDMQCPHLVGTDDGKYRCDIYETRPVACIQYDGIRDNIFDLVECKWKVALENKQLKRR